MPVTRAVRSQIQLGDNKIREHYCSVFGTGLGSTNQEESDTTVWKIEKSTFESGEFLNFENMQHFVFANPTYQPKGRYSTTRTTG